MRFLLGFSHLCGTLVLLATAVLASSCTKGVTGPLGADASPDGVSYDADNHHEPETQVRVILDTQMAAAIPDQAADIVPSAGVDVAEMAADIPQNVVEMTDVGPRKNVTDGPMDSPVDSFASDLQPTKATKTASCTTVSDKTKPIIPPPGRLVYCGIEAGSRSLKLLVASIEKGNPLSLRQERHCSAKLDVGVKVFDAFADAGIREKALPNEDIDALGSALRELADICKLDGGTLVGATTGEWARRALNAKDIADKVLITSGVTLDLASAETEGLYGYLSVTRNAPNKLVLDPGSSSFQLIWKVGTSDVKTLSVPLGFAQVTAQFWSGPNVSWDSAHAAYRTELLTRMTSATPNNLASLMADLPSLDKDLYVLGLEGAPLLAIRGKLRSTTTGQWIMDKIAVNQLVMAATPLEDPNYGSIEDLLMPSAISGFVTDLKQADFDQLRREPILGIYGEKVLGVAPLLAMVTEKLSRQVAVVVADELASGLIYAKIFGR